MNKAGGIVSMVAGVFSVAAAIFTLIAGGLGSAFNADGASTIVALGWGGIAFSFLVIVFGAVALYKPKGAGIALIVCSLAGAVLGGGIVAVFMVLSLIGGILCILGAKKAGSIRTAAQDPAKGAQEQPGYEMYSQLERLAALKDKGLLTMQEFDDEKGKLLSNSQASGIATDGSTPTPALSAELPKASHKSKRTALIVFGAVGALVLVSGVLRSNKQSGNAVKEDDPLATLAAARPTDIQPTGELAAMFTLGSDNTDLQRENKMRELTGQVIAWTLSVYDVTKRGDVYKVQTQSSFRDGSRVGAANVYHSEAL